jgi:hypothetical protein
MDSMNRCVAPLVANNFGGQFFETALVLTCESNLSEKKAEG